MNKKNISICILLVFSSLLFSCHQKKRFEIDAKVLKKTENSFHILRFDSAIICLDTNNMTAGLHNVAAKYAAIYEHYIDNLLEISAQDTSLTAEIMLDLLNDTTYSKINAAVMKTFADVAPIERKMASVYTYFKTYFPEIQLPQIFFFVSGCNRSVIMFPGYIGIGTDWYLGDEFYDFYSKLTYTYLAQNMKPEGIPVDITLNLLKGAFPMQSNQNRLIDNILYQGKLLYLVSVMLPNEQTENIAGYTAAQLAWCEQYERAMWAAIIEQKHLFSTDYRIIRDYTLDAPFTQPISQESPGRAGNWLGWQIVKSYMENNQNVTLQMLAAENDFGKMLEKSKYKP
ncbi:hypothetical protein FACS189429_0350 [Bacteroidia bacterium]|nr:hypothetical protein FACS189429_0350 [Bacteroidia bacterium]